MSDCQPPQFSTTWSCVRKSAERRCGSMSPAWATTSFLTLIHRAQGGACRCVPLEPRWKLFQACHRDTLKQFRRSRSTPPPDSTNQVSIAFSKLSAVIRFLRLGAQLSGLSVADADRALAAYWRQQLPDVEPSRTSWRFDDLDRLLVLEMEGEGKVDWDGGDTEGHTHYLMGGGFPPPNEMKRPKDQPQNAAWATDYPAFTCYATSVKLPVPGNGFHWSYVAAPVDRTLGGVEYWRISSFEDREIRMVKSRRVDVPEVSSAEAASVNAAIPAFDNNKVYAFETSATTDNAGAKYRRSVPSKGTHFGSFEEFAGSNPPCRSRVDR